MCLVRTVSFLYTLPCKSGLGRYLLHGDERYAFVSTRQRNEMIRATWDTAQLFYFHLFAYLHPFPGWRSAVAATRPLLRTPVVR